MYTFFILNQHIMNETEQIITLSYPNPIDRIFTDVISDIFTMLTEITLTISDPNETVSPVESEIVKSDFP